MFGRHRADTGVGQRLRSPPCAAQPAHLHQNQAATHLASSFYLSLSLLKRLLCVELKSLFKNAHTSPKIKTHLLFNSPLGNHFIIYYNNMTELNWENLPVIIASTKLQYKYVSQLNTKVPGRTDALNTTWLTRCVM